MLRGRAESKAQSPEPRNLIRVDALTGVLTLPAGTDRRAAGADSRRADGSAEGCAALEGRAENKACRGGSVPAGTVAAHAGDCILQSHAPTLRLCTWQEVAHAQQSPSAAASVVVSCVALCEGAGFVVVSKLG